MIAVGRRAVTASSAWLKIVFAHQPPDLLVIDDHASMPQLGVNASPAIEFEIAAIASTIAVSSCTAVGRS
jgi:hypothetical protein